MLGQSHMVEKKAKRGSATTLPTSAAVTVTLASIAAL